MYRLSTVLLSLAIVAGSAQSVLADEATPSAPKAAAARQPLGALAPALQGEPVIVRIHADWCPACKATQATIEQLRQTYGSRISFVQLDVTDAKAADASAQRANKLGLKAFFDAYKTSTSTVGIIDPRSGAVVATFYNDTNAADYTRAIDRVIKHLANK
ncbi:MAG: hypothetical protein PVSMB1_07960 [Gemmatimonadaceae bacterium]